MTNQPAPLHLDFHLLDRQIVDSAGELVAKVDDIECSVDSDGRVQLVALLAGQQVLGERIGGMIGRAMAAIARRFNEAESPQPLRIDYALVDRVEAEIILLVRRDTLPTPPMEAWLSNNVISRIPGGDHAGA
jgi:sporulation protein YlmC with PRC-barrel domain